MPSSEFTSWIAFYILEAEEEEKAQKDAEAAGKEQQQDKPK